MDTVNYIVKDQLPLHQDFTALKEKALGYIQSHIGYEWTNFNPSDPGITILDQICYALTELGYCTDFSIPDILTNSNGKIEIEDQFYLPAEILTTAPYTINDYKKYLIDAVPNIDNVLITTFNSNNYPFNKVYQFYLYISPQISNDSDRDNVCNEAYYYLNQSRNLGELFNKPIALQPINCLISCLIEIQKNINQYDLLLELQDKIRSFIFAKVVQTGYESALISEYTTAEIYDGPNLKNGWIPDNELTLKTDSVQVIDLIPIIESISGVVSVSGLQLLQDGKAVSVLQSQINQIIAIDVLNSYQTNNLVLSYNGKNLPCDITVNALNIVEDTYEKTTAILNKKETKKLPKSSFRDINTYYSIQNTFPEQYGVGADTIEDHSQPVKIAQSRQLKGYLTLFDQVLANQFSQLANISKLFSFKNSVCGAPSDEETFYAVKDKYQQKHLEYPVPYKMFSPSYFYQSLYNVPHIKPLLKDNKTFSYSTGNESETELKEKSWFEYQQDPYNPYIFGLMKIMEEEDTNLERRNKLLNHLLARHGESPKVIDSIIDDTIYTGDKRKDQIIVKSLYLQNLGLLSYNRQKAYNFLTAQTTERKPDETFFQMKEKHFQYINEHTTDFVFKSEELNKKEKIHQNDFNNFSGIELKLNLLFGLKNIYSNFINAQFESLKSNPESTDSNVYMTVQKTLWFIEKRKGSIFLETALLLKSLFFNLQIIKENQENTVLYQSENLDFQTISQLNNVLNTSSETVLDQELQNGYLSFSGTQFAFTSETESIIENQKEFIKSKVSNYAFRISIASGDGSVSMNSKVFKKDLLILFPDFVPAFQTKEFKQRLKQFLKISLPVNVSFKCVFINSQDFGAFILNYINWHKSLRFKDLTSLSQAEAAVHLKPVQPALNVISSLNQILESNHGRN